MQQSNITIDYLLNNDDFIAWVITSETHTGEDWNKLKVTLSGDARKQFDEAIKIVKKIRVLYADREENNLTSDFIQKQYIRLLESHYTSNRNQSRNKVLSLKPYLKYAAIFVLLLSVSGVLYFSIKDVNSFKNHLTSTTFNNKDVLIETADNEFFSINKSTSNNWLTNDGVFISADSSKIQFVLSDDINKHINKNFKIYTPAKKRYRIVMIDGTEIELNSNSVLSFNISKNTTNRMVTLTGEAFFDVTHNEKHPFIVQSSDLLVKVLGTEFNINNYPENNFTSATLVEGSVEVSNNKGSTRVITPGDRAKIYHSKDDIEVQRVDVQEVVAWTSGRMIFKDELLDELVPKLNRWFDVNFILKDASLKDYKFTGTLKKENDLRHFLQILKYTEGINYKIENKTVTLFYLNGMK